MYKDFLKDVRIALKELPEFKKMKVRIVVMKSPKKEENYGTSIRRFITDGEDKYSDEGVVYINFRDSPDLDTILSIIAHEVEHLLDDRPGMKEKVFNHLKSKNLSL